ncbi:MAG: hypothetical protein NC313_06520 [Butyrivibrio sp.]|nr:hypothetical protein [Butyrivibrio sp.]
MRRNVTKIASVMALTLIVAGSSSNVAYAHHGCSHKAVVQSPAVCCEDNVCDDVCHEEDSCGVVCYEDGSCDVDGVCILGADCDGTVHHTQTYCYSGNRRHKRHHH